MIPRPSGIEISSKIISVQFHSSLSNQWVNSLRNRSLFCANYRGRSLFCRGADLEQQLIVFMRCYSTVGIRSRASAWLAFPVLGLFHYTWRATTMNVRGILFSPVEPTIPVMWHNSCHNHYSDVIMGTIASQITSLSTVYSTIYSDTDQRKNIKAPRHWPLCGEFTGDRWIPRTNGQ